MVHLVRSSFAEKFRGLTLITAVRTASDSRMIRPIMKHGSARSEEPRRRRRPLNPSGYTKSWQMRIRLSRDARPGRGGTDAFKR